MCLSVPEAAERLFSTTEFPIASCRNRPCLILTPLLVNSMISSSSSSSRGSNTNNTNTTTTTHRGGTFSTLRNIFVKEGMPGIYAGLGATLVMGVPNTVLYFVSYDELISRLRNPRYGYEGANWTPALAGASARLLASLSTACVRNKRTSNRSKRMNERSLQIRTMTRKRCVSSATHPFYSPCLLLSRMRAYLPTYLPNLSLFI
jgi:hypothetical protein